MYLYSTAGLHFKSDIVIRVNAKIRKNNPAGVDKCATGKLMA